MLYQLEPQLFRKEIIKPIYENNIDFFEKYDHSLEYFLIYLKDALPILYNLAGNSSMAVYSALDNPIEINIVRQILSIFELRYIFYEKDDFLKLLKGVKTYAIIFLSMEIGHLKMFLREIEPHGMGISLNEIQRKKKEINCQLNCNIDNLNDAIAKFKQTEIYENIIDNFHKMHQFFTDEYNKYLQEKASANKLFNDF